MNYLNMLFLFVDSLNFVHRRQMVNRINKENKDMLKRIMQTKPCYDHVELELDYQVQTQAGRLTERHTDGTSDELKPRISTLSTNHIALIMLTCSCLS